MDTWSSSISYYLLLTMWLLWCKALSSNLQYFLFPLRVVHCYCAAEVIVKSLHTRTTVAMTENTVKMLPYSVFKQPKICDESLWSTELLKQITPNESTESWISLQEVRWQFYVTCWLLAINQRLLLWTASRIQVKSKWKLCIIIFSLVPALLFGKPAKVKIQG